MEMPVTGILVVVFITVSGALQAAALCHLPYASNGDAGTLADLTNLVLGSARGKTQLVIVAATQRETQRIVFVHQIR